MRIGNIAIILITVLVYAHSLGNGFVLWDDGLLITENPWIKGIALANILHAFTSYDPELYVPLTTLTYQLNYALSGLQPWIYHATNLALHIVNALLVVRFFEILLSRPGTATLNSRPGMAAMIGGLLFAVHPVHTESIAWASARKDVLMGMFFLLMFLAYVQYVRGGEKRCLWFSIGCYVLALLSKVSVILTPFVLLLLDWYEGRKIDRAMLLEKTPFVVLSIVFGVIASLGKITDSAFLWDKVLIGAKGIAFSLEKLLVPTGLSVLYPYTQSISLTTPDLFLSALIVLAITAVVMCFRKREPAFPFAWGLFLLLYLPTVSNIAKGHNELLDVYFSSDRYVYLPSLAVLFLIASLVARLEERWKRALHTGVLVVVLIFSLLAYRQSLVWKDSEALFRNVLRFYPNSYVAHTNVGSVLFRRSDVDGALAEYEKALAIRNDATTHFNVGQVHLLRGKTEEAKQSFRKAIESSPIDPDARLYLGALLIEEGNLSEALMHLERAVSLAPQNPKAHLFLGIAYEKLGRRDDAHAAFERALELDPQDKEAQEKLRPLE